MSREAWGDPPERQEPPQRCPVCDGEYHAEDCELGQEVARRLKAEAQVERLRSLLRQALDALEVESEWGGPTPKGAAAIASLREALGPNVRAEPDPTAKQEQR